MVDAAGIVHRREVKAGAYAEDGVPIESGLRPDEWVVAAGAHLMRDGEKVLPIDRDNRPVRIESTTSGKSDATGKPAAPAPASAG